MNELETKIVAVIPARYKSSRFPGKPLADICGKPMIWWVCQQVRKVRGLSDIVVATDSDEIQSVCRQFGINAMMTGEHPTHVHRIHEVSQHVAADYYIVVCGDEPLISESVIQAALPDAPPTTQMYVGGLCRYMSDPAEVIDPANIKVVTNEADECVLLSRAAVPFPYKTILFKYKKVIGVECYNKPALDFFVTTPKGFLETVEDVTLQRFLENKIHIKYKRVESDSLSVDTPRDLEKVRQIIENKKQAYGL
ncbi:MAG: 3-deoxy-manno-octulosonate cytidylyltransferase [Bacteroidales bacterium]|nr:3-deoxy-manno-octulosonate cytidylyltransferase [Bacteroidales bacterium]